MQGETASRLRKWFLNRRQRPKKPKKPKLPPKTGHARRKQFSQGATEALERHFTGASGSATQLTEAHITELLRCAD
eukprot:COSAG01_NODE_14308_length_1470_cov_23.158279_3_plen_76_part_00